MAAAEFADYRAKIDATAARWRRENFDACANQRASFRRIGGCVVNRSDIAAARIAPIRAQRQCAAANRRSARRSRRRRGSPVRSLRRGSSARTVPMPVSKRVGFVAQALDCSARCWAGDPGDAAGALRDLAVESERGFQRDERKLGVESSMAKSSFRVLRLLRRRHGHCDSGAAKFC